MMLVPAGDPVDAVIDNLLPMLEEGDLLIDGGNSHFVDTDRRAKQLRERGLAYLGVGVSGGAEGARRGPSLMPGGPRSAYDRVQGILEGAAAKVNGDPCVAYLGPGSAGHYVKMVHNGIEYGLMQLIAEVYDLMKRGLGMGTAARAEVFEEWSQGLLSGFLMEITAEILAYKEQGASEPLVERILDAAEQKGTGRWTSQSAMDLGVPIPTMDVAVAMRNLSALKGARGRMSERYEGETPCIPGERDPDLAKLRGALYACMILTYAQGMDLLGVAAGEHGYGLDLETVARIWRGGCIIRSALLEPIRSAYQRRPDLDHLLLDPGLASVVRAHLGDVRSVVAGAASTGIPAPAMMASLSYLDSFRSDRLPANLIQAQRDYFGAHTYERVDKSGTFHTEWREH
jgi:6-phosphogluconate dehydrogenase